MTTLRGPRGTMSADGMSFVVTDWSIDHDAPDRSRGKDGLRPGETDAPACGGGCECVEAYCFTLEPPLPLGIIHAGGPPRRGAIPPTLFGLPVVGGSPRAWRTGRASLVPPGLAARVSLDRRKR